jgi:hypothetical protein
VRVIWRGGMNVGDGDHICSSEPEHELVRLQISIRILRSCWRRGKLVPASVGI